MQIRLDWVNSPPEGDVDLVQTFESDDTEYGFIPNGNKLTFGEFVDLEHYATDGRLVENFWIGHGIDVPTDYREGARALPHRGLHN